MAEAPVLDPDSIAAAVERVRGHVRLTPVLDAGAGSFGIDLPLALKLELTQHSGSFKARGAYNTALACGVPPEGLLAASGGNHGLAVAFVAHSLGLPAEIYVPSVSSPVKRALITALGADVRVVGELYDDARAACEGRSRESGALLVPAYDYPLTVAGQATLGVELYRQCPEMDTVLVAVGGGGLAAGVAAALPSTVRVVCVEPVSSCCFHAAVEAGEPVPVAVSGVAADSLGARSVGALPWSILRGRAESVVVDDESILEARLRLWSDARVAAEAGGATALAALTSGAYSPAAGERIAVVVCGGNTDPSDLV